MLRDSTTGRILPEPAIIRFWRKVDPCRTDGCAIWLGALSHNGYGRFGRMKSEGSGFAYHFLKGHPSPGMQLDHLCRNPTCVWPDHLEEVTPQVNALRGETFAAENARKTHCPQGHPYDLFNTYRGQGRRTCRLCSRDKTRRYRERQRAKG